MFEFTSGGGAALEPLLPGSWPATPKAKLGMTGAESEMTESEVEMQRAAHAFAEKVLRPTGIILDKMAPEEVVAKNSPLFDVHREFRKLEFNPLSLAQLSHAERGRLLPIVVEELGWGDAGLAVSLGASDLPLLLSMLFMREKLVERIPTSAIGCWLITEPDHGTDNLDPSRQIFHPNGAFGRPNCVATIAGDKVVINGQKSAWPGNAPIAENAVLYCAADVGGGADPTRGCVIVVPLNTPGVSRGKPLDKIGQRPLPQGEIFFDNVTLSTDYIVAGPDDYLRAVYAVHSEANCAMGMVFTGAARAAFEMAYTYAHERRQGGVPIVRHQSVVQRLFHMYRKVEMSRALVRRVYMYNSTAHMPALQSAMAVKVTATQAAFEVASEALQMFGGNGLTKEYPIEKIFRDTRAAMIEDGCNEILSIKAGYSMVNADLLRE